MGANKTDWMMRGGGVRVFWGTQKENQGENQGERGGLLGGGGRRGGGGEEIWCGRKKMGS